jgi:hypothetical protein
MELDKLLEDYYNLFNQPLNYFALRIMGKDDKEVIGLLRKALKFKRPIKLVRRGIIY